LGPTRVDERTDNIDKKKKKTPSAYEFPQKKSKSKYFGDPHDSKEPTLIGGDQKKKKRQWRENLSFRLGGVL